MINASVELTHINPRKQAIDGGEEKTLALDLKLKAEGVGLDLIARLVGCDAAQHYLWDSDGNPRFLAVTELTSEAAYEGCQGMIAGFKAWGCAVKKFKLAIAPQWAADLVFSVSVPNPDPKLLPVLAEYLGEYLQIYLEKSQDDMFEDDQGGGFKSPGVKTTKLRIDHDGDAPILPTQAEMQDAMAEVFPEIPSAAQVGARYFLAGFCSYGRGDQGTPDPNDTAAVERWDTGYACAKGLADQCRVAYRNRSDLAAVRMAGDLVAHDAEIEAAGWCKLHGGKPSALGEPVRWCLERTVEVLDESDPQSEELLADIARLLADEEVASHD